jgi:ferritin-like protein
MSSEGFHVPIEKLSNHTKKIHYAISSLMEELEAVDWYYQRADDTDDEELRAVLLHNAHEEIEHASMVLEWLRRADPVVDKNLREYLFKEGSIVGREQEVEGGPTARD